MTDATDKTTQTTTPINTETAPKPTGPAASAAKAEAAAGSGPVKSRASSASKAAPKVAKPASTSQASSTSKSPLPDAKKGKGGGFLKVFVVLGLAGGAVYAGWPLIGPLVMPQVQKVIDGAQVRLGLVSQELPAVKAPAEPASPSSSPTGPEISPAPVAPPSPDVLVAPTPAQTVASGLDLLTSRLDVLEGQLGAASMGDGGDGQAALAATGDLARTLSDLKAQLEAVTSRLDVLEQVQAARANPTIAMQALVLGATQLRARLMGDTPFAAELKALVSIAGNDDVVRTVVARLRPNAEAGIPSEAALIARFAPVATDIMRAGTVSGEQGWWGTVKDSLSRLITVRRTDPARITNAVERAVSVAEAALQLGDLEGAVNALTPLQGAPSDAAAAWLGDARARVDAEAALEDLHNHALEALAQAGAG